MIKTIRLKPHADVYDELQKFAKEQNLQAGSIVSAVGSLEVVALRYSDRKETTVIEAKHEVLSLSGTLTHDGLHVHMSVADGEGRMLGGHLKTGSKVYTTLEIVILESPNEVYKRKLDETYGYEELVVEER